MTEETKPPETADDELMRLATEPEDGDERDDDAAAAEKDETDAKDEDEEARRLNRERTAAKRPWSKRVDILTARLRDAERRAAEVEARNAGDGDKATESTEPDPNDEKYEFGEADPQFLKDSARYEVRRVLAEERRKAGEAAAASAEQAEAVERVQGGVAEVQKVGTERYEDFEEKIADAVEARGGEPLPPLLSVGIAVSPAGADIAYKLATDDDAAERIERLAATNPQAAAVAFGELEAEFLADDNDSDLNLDDPLDMARMLGRERARRKGAGKKADDGAIERQVTRAPKPPESRSRGGSGQFEVADDTDDFAAFERKVMAGKK